MVFDGESEKWVLYIWADPSSNEIADLKDEFDREISLYQIHPNNRIWINGGMLLGQAKDLFHFDFSESEFDTIGGLFINTIGHVPLVNEEITIDGHKFRVEKMSGRGVAVVSFLANESLIAELTQADTL